MVTVVSVVVVPPGVVTVVVVVVGCVDGVVVSGVVVATVNVCTVVIIFGVMVDILVVTTVDVDGVMTDAKRDIKTPTNSLKHVLFGSVDHLYISISFWDSSTYSHARYRW